MSPWPTNHLTADDLDAFHSGSLSSEMRLHLETCDSCRQLVAADVQVMAALGRLESLGPSAGFADRVMAQVVIDKPAPVPVLSYPALSRPRRMMVVGMAAAMVASVAWSAAYRPELEALLGSIGSGLLQLGGQLVRTVTSELTGQAWFAAARSAALQPGRIAVGVLVGVLAYGTGLMALRRLLTPSAAPVSNAKP